MFRRHRSWQHRTLDGSGRIDIFTLQSAKKDVPSSFHCINMILLTVNPFPFHLVKNQAPKKTWNVPFLYISMGFTGRTSTFWKQKRYWARPWNAWSTATISKRSQPRRWTATVKNHGVEKNGWKTPKWEHKSLEIWCRWCTFWHPSPTSNAISTHLWNPLLSFR